MPNTPKYWRDRADEVRAELDHMSDAEARKMMLAVVDHCEKLAEILERHAVLGLRLPEKK